MEVLTSRIDFDTMLVVALILGNEELLRPPHIEWEIAEFDRALNAVP
jgi:hypothetical protein